MVTFKPQGRLGNFLFAAATTIAYAKRHNLDYTMPAKTNDGYWNPIYFDHLIKEQYIEPDIIIEEKTLFKYDELPFEESWRNKRIELRGYFQNEKYFNRFEHEIRDIFGDPMYVYDDDFVGVHVRRGDYLNLSEKHPQVSAQWYTQAMDRFKQTHFFKVFSDDIEWCRENFKQYDCKFISNRDPLDDLWSLSNCDHQIISASTFGWWGAYLNQNSSKKIIVPKQWLTPSHSNEWTEQIVLRQWIRI